MLSFSVPTSSYQTSNCQHFTLTRVSGEIFFKYTIVKNVIIATMWVVRYTFQFYWWSRFMSTITESSDVAILDLLRKFNSMDVVKLATATGVTSTAVRQRLSRLMAQGFVQRSLAHEASRGRPSHRYSLTDKGKRKTGANFVDLSIALWKEIRAIEDHDVRQGLLQRLAKTMAGMYAEKIHGVTVEERMRSISELFSERDVPFSVDHSGKLPVLHALACPYPELAEQDPSICAMETLLFSELVGQGIHLSACRLDGHGCCTFETN